jgi:hypothetical protein
MTNNRKKCWKKNGAAQQTVGSLRNRFSPFIFSGLFPVWLINQVIYGSCSDRVERV